jgi:hypothetical protein
MNYLLFKLNSLLKIIFESVVIQRLQCYQKSALGPVVAKDVMGHKVTEQMAGGG